MLFASFIAFLEVAEAAGVVKMPDAGAEPDNTADALDGNHQRRLRQRDVAGMPLEQRKQQLLLRHMPAAIAGREAVSMPPAQLLDARLQRHLHLVGSLLGDDAAQGVGNKHPHHVALRLQLLLKRLILPARRSHKQRISLGAAQLAQDDTAHVERRQLPRDEIAEPRPQPRANLIYNIQCLPPSRLVRFRLVIAHLPVNVSRLHQQIIVCQRLLRHLPACSLPCLQK